MDLKEIIEMLAKLEPAQLKIAFKKITEKLSWLLSSNIVKGGLKLDLKPGDVLFSEGDTFSKFDTGVEVFIILDGEVTVRTALMEASNHSTRFGKGDLVGDERLLLALSEFTGEKSKITVQDQKGISQAEKSFWEELAKTKYCSTAIVTSVTATVIGLDAKSCVEFLTYNPKTLAKLLKSWIFRFKDMEALMLQLANVARGFELDINALPDAEKVIEGLIHDGDATTLAGVIISLKRQITETNNFFLAMEKEQRQKDAKICELRNNLTSAQDAVATFMEILYGGRSRSTAPLTDDDISSLLDAVRDPKSEKDSKES